MQIELKHIKIRDLFNGYQNNDETGIIGYGGKLDIRPPYQREFVYDERQQKAVIETIFAGFPLNVMYWAVRDDGGFEIIDGQQRTLSICEFLENNFDVEIGVSSNTEKSKCFYVLQPDEQDKILDYELMVYFCKGTPSEKLEWFKTINIAGEELTNQELRNAVYHGSWVTDTKKYFSKNNCPAYNIGSDYLKGSLNRQDYLETALKWISNNKIESYMNENSKKENANELWDYFQSVIDWVQETFPTYRSKLMKGLEWGYFYNEYKDRELNPKELEEQIKQLIDDEEIQKQKGIYQYLLTGEEKHLNLRTFNDEQKQTMYERQKGICPMCKGSKNENKTWKIEEMEADHIIAWSKGGKTEIENGQMLCKKHNKEKSNK